MTKECDVCHGTPGLYPIIDRYGTELYNIRCPECFGTGEAAPTDDEYQEQMFANEQRRKYDAAMREKAARTHG